MPICLSVTRLEQLGFNALLQLMIGVPLEMVHGLLRISLLYLAGVLAGEAGAQPPATSPEGRCLTAVPLLHTGSLTVSITDMRAPVVGGSGGVYALCSAHLANVVMVMKPPGWAGEGPRGLPHRLSHVPSELGWDEVSLQAAENGAGPGVQ